MSLGAHFAGPEVSPGILTLLSYKQGHLNLPPHSQQQSCIYEYYRAFLLYYNVTSWDRKGSAERGWLGEGHVAKVLICETRSGSWVTGAATAFFFSSPQKPGHFEYPFKFFRCHCKSYTSPSMVTKHQRPSSAVMLYMPPPHPTHTRTNTRTHWVWLV